MTAAIDRTTRDWIRGPADERAAQAGCRFDAERGLFVVEWVERHCRLYEGDWAGEPMVLMPWARDATMRLFGWVRHSEKWQRWVRRFRQAGIWVAKKNGKSPLLAAWGLYLLCGDGEQGQKVFLAAKDGTQARTIAGEHAKQMLLQSPELLAECKLNENTLRISHTPTRSFMEPLSSSNTRTQQSKEGLNGSVLIDEVHVVDRDFVRRLSRAGISRSEPLQIEVSTAGNDPDGYGKERFDHALAVERGEKTDHGFLAVIHAAPQELTDLELEADPLKYGKMANPAMGHTVDPEEYLTDFESSKRSLLSLADFKMYRLNVWQHSSNPWLRAADWERCKLDFTEADLEGKECWAGLDLSRTRDLTALVYCFHGEEEGEYLLLPRFWLPEARARELESIAPFREWAAQGWLTLTPGDVVDFGWVKAQFRRDVKRFLVRELAYDPRFAEEVTQQLEQGETDDAGRQTVAETGVTRFAFAQNDANYAAPTDDYERLVSAGKLRHDGNPVLAWQVGHAQIRLTWNKAKRVCKPTKDDPRTVDGVQAGIMALARATQAEPASVYETRGLETVGAGRDEAGGHDDEDDW